MIFLMRIFINKINGKILMNKLIEFKKIEQDKT